MFINHSSKEVTAKIVFYGPGLSGKTTCIQYIFSVTNPNSRGELISIETEIERTLFFDLLPINVGLVKGYQTKFQLYTVPGQVFYDSTRKLVLKGADGVVFVADSQQMMEQQNRDSLENLKKNLVAHKLDIKATPMVFQYNKRDLKDIISIEKLNRMLNPGGCPFFGTIATKGEGVIEALREISSLILKKIKGLLDQGDESDPRVPMVEFDTDKKHKIIDKEHLPLKKIHADSLKNIDQQILPKEMMMTPPHREKDRHEEEMPRVETVEEIEDLGDILVDEEPISLSPLDELEEPEDPGEIPFDVENKSAHQTGKLYDDIDFPEFDELENEETLAPPKRDTKSDTKNDTEVDIDTAEFRAIEEFLAKEKEREASGDGTEELDDSDKLEPVEIDEDNEPFKDLDLRIDMDDELGATKIELPIDLDEDIQDLQEIGELVEETGTPKPAPTPVRAPKEETREAEPFKLHDAKKPTVHPSPPSPQKPPTPTPTPPHIKKPEPPKEIKEIKKVPHASSPPSTHPSPPPPQSPPPHSPHHPAKPAKDLKEANLPKQHPEIEKNEKKIKEAPAKPKAMDIFDQFKDKSRLTIIKAISVKDKGPDTPLFIEIKDTDSNLLESVKVQITPEIKKITLILDVKK